MYLTKYNMAIALSKGTVTGNNSNDHSTMTDMGTTRDDDPIAVYFDVYYRYFFHFRSVPIAKERWKSVTRQAFKIKHDTAYRNARAPGFVILFLSHAQFPSVTYIRNGVRCVGIALSLWRFTFGLLFFFPIVFSDCSGHPVCTLSGYRLWRSLLLVVSIDKIDRFIGRPAKFHEKPNAADTEMAYHIISLEPTKSLLNR